MSLLFKLSRLVLFSILTLGLLSPFSVRAAADAPAQPYAGPLAGVSVLAAGDTFSCVLTSGGGVKCWGYNNYGQLGNGTTIDSPLPVDVTGLTSGVIAVASGRQHACAVTSGGAVKCWGENAYGQLGDNTKVNRSVPVQVSGALSGYNAVTAGATHSCARTTGGSLKCWGDNGSGQLGNGTNTESLVPVLLTGLGGAANAVTAADFNTCAVLSSGALKCWGSNSSGKLGDGTADNRNTPTQVTGLTSGVQMAALGGDHTCAVLSSGTIKCWGYNGDGQLGTGNNDSSYTPVSVSSLGGSATQIDAGTGHTCARLSTGAVKCWGSNSYGKLGNGGDTSQNSPILVSGLGTNGAQVSAGDSHTCARTLSGGVKCWGRSFQGRLGDGTPTNRQSPANVATLGSGYQAVAAGMVQSCAITPTDGAKCWGANYNGTLGNNSEIESHLPVDVSSLSTAADITAGGYHVCVLTTGNGIKCWGSNAVGQLGTGGFASSSVPVDVFGLTSGADQVSAGWQHTCALVSGGGMYCWGTNWSGQLGMGAFNQGYRSPYNVTGLGSPVSMITAGLEHTCALTATELRCWGNNGYGQLGNGSNTNSAVPVIVSGSLSGLRAIAAGRHHTCAVTSGGTVKCWGRNTAGQLGDGTLTNRTTPVDVPGLSDVAEIYAGGYHTCALLESGALKCWGSNRSGQLGDGTFTNSSAPVDAFGLGSDVSDAALGDEHTCALVNGRVKCWGIDWFGQTGQGTPLAQYNPVDVAAGLPPLVVGNYGAGSPDSVITFEGANFEPETNLTVSLNGAALETLYAPLTLTTNATGGAIFAVDLGGGLADGVYFVTVSDGLHTTGAVFRIDSSAPPREPEGSAPILLAPAVAPAVQVFLPTALRE